MCGCIVMSCSLFTVMYSTVNSDLSFYISFHRFPADPEVRAQWLIKIRRENFSPVACTRVCSRHFQTGDFAVTAGGKRTLNRGAVPCLFAWNSLVYLCLPPAIAAPDSDSEMDVQLAQDHDYCVTPTTSAVTDALSDENEALWRRVQELEHRLETLQLQSRFGLHRLAGSDEDIRFYTSNFNDILIFLEVPVSLSNTY
uniref:THAP domain-containing protein 1 n=1 Tax=Astyanax mexicanus TaxID=7994 RepID=A0A3B1KL06_ASTMX